MPYIELWRTVLNVLTWHVKISIYYMVIFPKLTSFNQVPLVEPMNSYYMFISPKLTLVTWVPLVEPMFTLSMSF